MNLSLAAFLICLGLTARLTRLFVDDALLAPVRTWIQAHAEPIYSDARAAWVTPKASRLLPAWKFANKIFNCSWCFSVYASAAVFALAATLQAHSASSFQAMLWVGAAASASYLTGVASVLVSRYEDYE